MIFRALFAGAAVSLLLVRLHAQLRLRRRSLDRHLRRAGPADLVGGLAAMIAVVFGLEYLLLPGAFPFAYRLQYPHWLRWVGVVSLYGGVLLMALSQRELGAGFSSVPMVDEEQLLVETGPYRWIRHPIYLAYVLAYLGGGLVSSNVVLTLAPAALFCVMLWGRIELEESELAETFGVSYLVYMHRTRRFLPFPRGPSAPAARENGSDALDQEEVERAGNEAC